MLSRIRAIFRDYGYIIYTRPYQLNIVGLRSKSVASNSFDDEIHVFYMTENGGWRYHIFPATTDPGTFWLNNPEYPEGTAILAQGQYVDSYEIGTHKGLYEALVQRRPVTVIRDYDRNSILDFKNGRKQTGMFGINIHRAESKGSTKFINKHSAGCQVFKNAGDFELFISLCRNHVARYGNSFTYSLIDFRALNRVAVRRIVTATTIAASLIIGLIYAQ